jgi:hypothetical protein
MKLVVRVQSFEVSVAFSKDNQIEANPCRSNQYRIALKNHRRYKLAVYWKRTDRIAVVKKADRKAIRSSKSNFVGTQGEINSREIAVPFQAHVISVLHGCVSKLRTFVACLLKVTIALDRLITYSLKRQAYA